MQIRSARRFMKIYTYAHTATLLLPTVKKHTSMTSLLCAWYLSSSAFLFRMFKTPSNAVLPRYAPECIVSSMVYASKGILRCRADCLLHSFSFAVHIQVAAQKYPQSFFALVSFFSLPHPDCLVICCPCPPKSPSVIK